MRTTSTAQYAAQQGSSTLLGAWSTPGRRAPTTANGIALPLPMLESDPSTRPASASPHSIPPFWLPLQSARIYATVPSCSQPLPDCSGQGHLDGADGSIPFHTGAAAVLYTLPSLQSLPPGALIERCALCLQYRLTEDICRTEARQVLCGRRQSRAIRSILTIDFIGEPNEQRPSS